jgi:hypothetical protein
MKEMLNMSVHSLSKQSKVSNNPATGLSDLGVKVKHRNRVRIEKKKSSKRRNLYGQEVFLAIE